MRMVIFAFFAFFAAMLVAFSVIYVAAQNRYSLVFYEDALRRAIDTKSIQVRNYFEADLAILHAMSLSPAIVAFLAGEEGEAVEESFWREFNSYKSLVGERKSLYFVSKSDNNIFFDTGYVYVIDEKLPSSYWFDSTLAKTDLYNFSVDFDPYLDRVLVWINFPVFRGDAAVGALGLGIDVDSFADSIEGGVGDVEDFVVFNESEEVTFYKDHRVIKNKNNVGSILPEQVVDELLAIAREGGGELLLRGGSAYMIERLPFMRSYLVASSKTEFAAGFGNLFLVVSVLVLCLTLAFLVLLYKFVRTIVSPLHYFSSLTRTILREVPIYIAVFGRDGRIKFISRQMSDLVGRDVGGLWEFLLEIEAREGFFEVTKEFELGDDGKSSYFKVVKMDVERDNGSGEQNSIIYLSNVSEQMYLANTDALTGIANRRHFNERAGTEFYNSQRDKTSIAFLMLDIDFFKRMNDKFGHLAGDEVLKEIVGIVGRVVVRKTDLLGRFGGEEFVVMLHNTDAEGARVVADRIRVCVEESVFKVGGGSEVRITVSIGIYSGIPNSFDSLKSFLNEADKKLYEAKDSGRNKVCW